ncbi:ermin-like [Gymnodraco acuticeps]|uniref:Ermin-like n=1 Tax=Gymnodraco acuticeps TaxID=8218 RepID=A0A6P8VNH2_GYMAC|nr:ermin-like [Gymnodraco acuticeps]
MDMETSTIPPKPPRLAVDEDTLASQVLEIIGGITREALQTLQEPEEKDVWLMEEGDDSVFYSDEDQVHQDITTCGFGANGFKPLVNSVADVEEEPGEEYITDKESSELKEELNQHVIVDEQELRQEGQTVTTQPMDQSDPQTESDLTSEKSESACGESSKCTIAEMQTAQNTSAEKVNLPVEKEGVTPNPEPSAVTNERGYGRLNGEADVSQQMSNADLQVSGDRPLQVEPEEERNFLIPGGFHQKLSPGYSTLPLPKKSCSSDGDQKSFSHLTSPKYGTVSYRKIRRGNTRQKIEEFEYMMMNL